jgi:hypothetical protein
MLHPTRPWLLSRLAIVAILIAGCSAPVSPSPSPSIAASASAATPASATISTEPTTAPSSAAPASPPTATGWQLVTLPDQANVANVADLAAGADRIVAVGGAAPVGAPRALSSADGGTTWTVEDIPADSRTPSRIVAWGDRFLVAGAGEFDCSHPFALETWVRSADGTWSAAPADPKLCVGGSGDLAVKGDTAVMAGIGSGDVPFLWSSADGLHWTDRTGAIQPDTAPRAVIADGSGFTVFGSSQGGPWDARSADGSVWQGERIPGNADVVIVAAFHRGAQPAVIAESGSAVGVISQGSNGLWQAELAAGLAASMLSRVVVVEGGLVALGGGESGPRLLASADGTSWRELEPPPGSDATTTLTGALVTDGRAFLTGQTEVGGRAIGAIWVGPAALLAP